MKLVIAAVLVGGAAFAGPVDAKKSPLLANWNAIVAGGCDLDAAHVHTPIEARVLRNLPYAQKGHVFKSYALTTLFASDGGWYTPNPDAKPSFTPAEGACIKALKTREAALRKTMPWPRQWEEKFTSQHRAVVHLRSSTRGGFGPVTYVHKDSEGWTIGGADCKGKAPTEENMCWILNLFCSAGTGTLECGVSAPG
jgi:hypothetical protein